MHVGWNRKDHPNNRKVATPQAGNHPYAAGRNRMVVISRVGNHRMLVGICRPSIRTLVGIHRPGTIHFVATPLPVECPD